MKQPRLRHELSMPRRRLLQGASAVASLGLAATLPVMASSVAPGTEALAAKTFDEALHALGGELLASPLVTLEVPATADNGAFVPVTVASTLPGAREILLLVDNNPQPVAAHFVLPAGTEPFVATRIRMAASGTVHAVVRTEAGLFGAQRSVQVAVGGCA